MYFLPVVAFALLASGAEQPATDDGAEERSGEPRSALALEREVARITASNAGGEDLWPDFDPLAVPLAVYDGSRTFLFRHPSPPGGFVPISGAPSGTYVLEGRHKAVVANTNAEIGGVATATVLLDAFEPDSTATYRAAVAIHEAFHAWQRANHPDWAGNVAVLFTYPTDAVELLALRRLETRALRKAFAADTSGDPACWARLALALRGDRYARMESTFVAYEHGTELNEGLATYIQQRSAGLRTMELPESGFGPADIRARATETGAAIAMLLDRLTPDWKTELAARDGQMLSAALSAAVGSGETCAFDDELIAGAELTAKGDVAALLEDRAQRLAAFEARPGWRVVVQVTQGDLLMPRGIDPINVQRLDAKRVLHTRFLRLGNEAGELEVMDQSAMTEGAGSHPLFQGVRRVTLTGLPKPRMSEAGGHVSLVTPHVTVEFDHALVRKDDETVIVRLGQ